MSLSIFPDPHQGRCTIWFCGCSCSMIAPSPRVQTFQHTADARAIERIGLSLARTSSLSYVPLPTVAVCLDTEEGPQLGIASFLPA
jgi:hypothetical protein